MAKVCSKCEIAKPESTEYFYANRTRGCGLASQCKVCTAAGQNRRGRQRREKLYYERDNKKDLARINARSFYSPLKVQCAVINCSRMATDLHHVNYDLPRDVIALCKAHHKMEHDLK